MCEYDKSRSGCPRRGFFRAVHAATPQPSHSRRLTLAARSLGDVIVAVLLLATIGGCATRRAAIASPPIDGARSAASVPDAAVPAAPASLEELTAKVRHRTEHARP